MAKPYLILKVKSGSELSVHDLLTGKDIDIPCYTPFKQKMQQVSAPKRKQARKLRKPEPKTFMYAEPTMGGWFFAAPQDDSALLRLLYTIERRSFMYGVISGPNGYYSVSEAKLRQVRSHKDRDGNYRSYDPKHDSRKNKQRIYAKAIEIPKFTNEDIVRLMNGSFAGVDMKVESVEGEAARLSTMIFGRETFIDASVFDLIKMDEAA